MCQPNPIVYQQEMDAPHEPDRGKWFWYDDAYRNDKHPKYLGEGDVGPFDTEDEANNSLIQWSKDNGSP